MKCKEKGCGGKIEISSDKAVSLRTGCGGCGTAPHTNAYPCNKCGSLHYNNGSSVFTRGGANVFLKDGEVVGKTVKPNAPVGQRISFEPL